MTISPHFGVSVSSLHCVCVWQCYTPPCLAVAAPQASANQFPWFPGSTIVTADFLRGHLPLTGLFSSLMGDHLTLFMVGACEVNSLCVCVILFCTCTCMDKGISSGLVECVCVCLRVCVCACARSKNVASTYRHQTPIFLFLLFLPMRQRGR